MGQFAMASIITGVNKFEALCVRTRLTASGAKDFICSGSVSLLFRVPVSTFGFAGLQHFVPALLCLQYSHAGNTP